MKHFGDITKIHGDQVPIVDIITGGSPCQDLSVAGKRAGLAGERSGLFMEQMRIVKEMRNESKRRLSVSGSDYDIRCVKPRYMVWENVAGAFSSGNPKGADFKAVLEEICKVVVEKIPDIPIPKNGWSYAGCIEGMGDDGTPFSIAWRLHDAQYWGRTIRDSDTGNVLKMGTPQRRRRIALVADFGGKSAPQILFECKSMSGNTEQSEQKREETSGDVRKSFNQSSSYTVKVRGGVEIDSLGHKAGKGALVQEELSGTLGVSQDQTLFQNVSDNKCLNPWDVQSKHIQPKNGKAEALYSGECRGGGGESYVMQKKESEQIICLQGNGIDRANTAGCNGKGWREDKAYTLDTIDRHAVCQPCNWDGSQIAPTLTANNANGSQRMPDKENFNGVITLNHGGFMTNADKSGIAQTLQATDYKDPQVVVFDSYNLADTGDKGRCLATNSGGLNEHMPIVCGVDAFNQTETKDKTMPLTSAATDSNHIPCVMESKDIETKMEHDATNGDLVYAVDQGAGKSGCNIDNDKTPTLTTTHGGEPAICYGLDRASFNQGKNAKYDFSVEEEKAQPIVARGPGGGNDVIGSLCARDFKGVGNQYVEEGKCIVQFYSGQHNEDK